MPNGSGENSAEWRAIDKMRDDLGQLQRGDAVREEQFNTLNRGQQEMSREFAAFQESMRTEVRNGIGSVNQRIDKWVTSLKWAVTLIVPVATAAITLWLSNPGGP